MVSTVDVRKRANIKVIGIILGSTLPITGRRRKTSHLGFEVVPALCIRILMVDESTSCFYEGDQGGITTVMLLASLVSLLECVGDNSC